MSGLSSCWGRARLLGIVCVVFLAGVGIVATIVLSRDAGADESSAIKGTVTDPETGDPLADLCVHARRAGTDTLAGTQTAEDGTYRVFGLEAGDYKVRAGGFPGDECGAGDRLARWYPDAEVRDDAGVIELADGATASGIDLALPLGGAIAGTVTDHHGDPQGGVEVHGLHEHRFASVAHTDEDGAYRLRAMPAGDATVSFDPPRDSDLLGGWHGGDSLEDSEPVQVNAGETTEDIDAQLELGGIVAGRVADRDGEAIGDVCVRASGIEDRRAASTRSADDGTYEAHGAPPGDVTVQFNDCGDRDLLRNFYDDAQTRSDADPVAVEAGERTEDIDGVMRQGGGIAGTVTNNDDDPMEDLCVAVEPLEGDSSESLELTGADGTYRAGSLSPVDHRVSVRHNAEHPDRCGGGESWETLAVYDDADSLDNADPVTVTADQETSGIDLAVNEDDVAEEAPVHPAAALTADPETGEAPLHTELTVEFDHADDHDLAWSIEADGEAEDDSVEVSPSSGVAAAPYDPAVATATVEVPQTVDFSVTVEDEAGNVTTDMVAVEATDDPLEADLEVTPSSGPSPLDVRADVAVTGGQSGKADYTLDWGDGSPSDTGTVNDSVSESHTFDGPGDFPVEVVVDDGQSTARDQAEVRATAPTTTEVSASPSSPVVGQTVEVTGQVHPDDSDAWETPPDGQVSLDANGALLGVVALEDEGTFTDELSFDSAGEVTLTASYEGDERWSPSQDTAELTVEPAPTSVTLSSTPSSPSPPGEDVEITARVTVEDPGQGTPQGQLTVTINEREHTIDLNGGAGSVVVSDPERGDLLIRAAYPGTDDYLASEGGKRHVVGPPIRDLDDVSSYPGGGSGGSGSGGGGGHAGPGGGSIDPDEEDPERWAQIVSEGPVSHLATSETLGCVLRQAGDELPATDMHGIEGLAASEVPPGEPLPDPQGPVGCATLLDTAEGVVGPARPTAAWDGAFEPVSQRQGGAGTPEDPHEIVTVVETELESGTVRVTQTDRYVDGRTRVETGIDVEGPVGEDAQVVRTVSCHLSNYPKGYRLLDVDQAMPGCREAVPPDDDPGEVGFDLAADSDAAGFLADDSDAVGQAIADDTPLPNRGGPCDELHDNAVAVSAPTDDGSQAWTARFRDDVDDDDCVDFSNDRPEWVDPTPSNRARFDVPPGHTAELKAVAEDPDDVKEVEISTRWLAYQHEPPLTSGGERGTPGWADCQRETGPTATLSCEFTPEEEGLAWLEVTARDDHGKTSRERMFLVGGGVGGGERDGTVNHAALGESFASGTGAGDYEYSPLRYCARSKNALPFNLTGTDHKSHLFRACHGAEIRHLTEEHEVSGWRGPGFNETEAPQIEALRHVEPERDNRATDLVTVSMGGNDVSFKWIAADCVARHDCPNDLIPTPDGVRKLDDIVRQSMERQEEPLAEAYAELRRSSNATVAVLPYPDFGNIPVGGEACGEYRVPGHSVRIGLSEEEHDWISERIQQLNEVIERAAATAGVHVIDRIEQSVRGHELCTSDAWVNYLPLSDAHVDTSSLSESFHPNRFGHRAFANDVEESGILRLPPNPPPEPDALDPAEPSDERFVQFREPTVEDQTLWNEVSLGSQLEVGNFEPDETYEVRLYSEPRRLDDVTADERGVVEVGVPHDVPVGKHRLELVGPAPEDATGVWTLGLEVVEPEDGGSGGSDSSEPDEPGSSNEPSDDTGETQASSDGGQGSVDPEEEQEDSSDAEAFQELGEACPEAFVPETGFTDIAGNVHEPNINCVAWYELTLGVRSDTYAPALGVRRDQMAAFLVRLLETAGMALPPPVDQGFTDIAGNVHADAINQLAALDLAHGTTPATYAPAEAVRRDQLASLLVRAYEHVDGAAMAGPPSGFSDTGGNPHANNIDKAAAAGFTQGATASTYEPASATRRDQIASLLARTLARAFEDGYVTPPM